MEELARYNMMNKRADISVMLIVLMTLALTIAALFAFLIANSNINEVIGTSNSVQEVYFRESLVNFYVQEILQNSYDKLNYQKSLVQSGIGSDVIFGKSIINSLQTQEEIKAQFISNFKQELENYKDENGKYFASELEQLEKQADNTEILDDKISMTFEIDINDARSINDRDSVAVGYIYSKKFSTDVNTGVIVREDVPVEYPEEPEVPGVEIEGMISQEYISRYSKYQTIFEKYASENLPNGMETNSFKALLAAVATKESSMGEGSAGDIYLMGYDNKHRPQYDGPENQVKYASERLKDALEDNMKYYKDCYCSMNPDYCAIGSKKIKCILTIYNMGDVNNAIGKEYAEIVYEFYGKWRNYFNS